MAKEVDQAHLVEKLESASRILPARSPYLACQSTITESSEQRFKPTKVVRCPTRNQLVLW